MKISTLVGERVKENPSDVTVKSHQLLLRGGFIKMVGSGIYSLMPLAKRATLKIENIIREEMNLVDGQEVLFPVVMPAELWEESGRYQAIAEELARFTDRNDKKMVLGMTHEEAAVHLARNTISSYNQLPVMIYQIQTKFRDEKRPRAGLIRVREFTMKDGYSFHLTQEDLEQYYNRVHNAYERIFKRLGMKNFISVKSDTGMMGGSVAHEFMLLTDIGEDTLVLCHDCDYKANMEVAESVRQVVNYGEDKALEKVYTGEAKEISEVCSMLNVSDYQTLKAVAFAVKGEDKGVLVFIRGDLEVNEAKLKKIIKAEIVPSDLRNNTELVAGNIGPINLNLKNTQIVYDQSVKGAFNLVCGANLDEYHYVGFNQERDLKNVTFVDVAKVKDKEICKLCGGEVNLKNGIEIGNIFQLGTKYSKAMSMTVHNEKGEEVTPIMGCYGIGVGRALAGIVEESNDDKGIIFPMSIAPFEVYLASLRPDDLAVKEIADKVYQEFKASGIDVLYDDRAASPGVKFAEHELIGIPLRVVISPRNIKENLAEVSSRDGKVKEFVKLGELNGFIKNLIASMKEQG